ncbi:MAG: DsrE family protein [Methanomassiliicoccales archaeon]|nr:DsrE family protein [Methanomassiliicoccales archaeon]
MTKTLTIHIRSGTMMNMDTNVMVKLARAAIDKGYKVNVFGYGEGVMAIKEGQEPKRFPNVGKEVDELAKRGLVMVVCETCCAARGLRRGEEIKTTKIGSLTNDLSRFVAESDRMITLAR